MQELELAEGIQDAACYTGVVRQLNDRAILAIRSLVTDKCSKFNEGDNPLQQSIVGGLPLSSTTLCMPNCQPS